MNTRERKRLERICQTISRPALSAGPIRADGQRYGQVCLENSVLGWDYWAAIRLGGIPPNSRYRESVTPLSACKVMPATADVEADGLKEPNPRAEKLKELCCTLKGIQAKRLKRVFNGAAFMPMGAGIEISECSACGGPMRIIAESRTTASKIRCSSAKYCRTWKREAAPYRQGQQSVFLQHAHHRQGFASHRRSHGWLK